MNSASCSIISRLGGGAMSQVFLARPADGGAPFVVKRLAAHLCGNSEYTALFRHEARLLGALAHPAIPRLIGFFDDPDAPEIHMQFMPGRSLLTVLQESRKHGAALPLPEVRRILRGLLDGVTHVHEARNAAGAPLMALHRDLCPLNVIVGPQNAPALIDFGSAYSRMLESEPEGALFGRFSYLAPERTSGGRATAASDIFSLGVMAYELFCGAHPFRDCGPEATLRNIESASFLAPGCARPGLPRGLEKLVKSMLARNPRGRPPDARTALAELDALEF